MAKKTGPDFDIFKKEVSYESEIKEVENEALKYYHEIDKKYNAVITLTKEVPAGLSVACIPGSVSEKTGKIKVEQNVIDRALDSGVSLSGSKKAFEFEQEVSFGGMGKTEPKAAPQAEPTDKTAQEDSAIKAAKGKAFLKIKAIPSNARRQLLRGKPMSKEIALELVSALKETPEKTDLSNELLNIVEQLLGNDGEEILFTDIIQLAIQNQV